MAKRYIVGSGVIERRSQGKDGVEVTIVRPGEPVELTLDKETEKRWLREGRINLPGKSAPERTSGKDGEPVKPSTKEPEKTDKEPEK